MTYVVSISCCKQAICPCVEDIYHQLKCLTAVHVPTETTPLMPPADEPVGKFMYFCDLQCFNCGIENAELQEIEL